METVDTFPLTVPCQECPIGTGELVDALVWITDQRDLAARTDKLLNDGLMSRTDVLRFVDQNMRIAADKGAQDAGLFCQVR